MVASCSLVDQHLPNKDRCDSFAPLSSDMRMIMMMRAKMTMMTMTVEGKMSKDCLDTFAML